MEMQHADVEPVTVSDILGLDTWNRPRTNEELRSFITSRHNSLPDSDEIS